MLSWQDKCHSISSFLDRLALLLAYLPIYGWTIVRISRATRNVRIPSLISMAGAVATIVSMFGNHENLLL